MKRDDLIQKLSQNLQPVKPMLSPARMTLNFTLLGLGFVAFSFLLMSTRNDLSALVYNPKFLFEIFLAFALSISALALAVYLSRPGQGATVSKLSKVSIGLLAFALIYNIFQVIGLSQSQIHLGLNLSGFECFAAVFGFAIMLGAALVYWLKAGASVNPNASGLVIATAGVALGNVSILFFCGFDNGMHVFLYHFAFPLVVASFAGLLSARLFLRW